MLRWREEFVKHPIFTTIKLFGEVESLDIKIEDPLLESERIRFSKFFKFFEITISSLDPDLAPIDLLSQIQNTLHSHNAIATATSLIRGQNPVLLSDLNTQISPSLSYIFQLSSAPRRRDTTKLDQLSASEGFERFSKRADERLKRIESITSEIEAKVASTFTRFEDIVARSVANSEAFQERLSSWNAQHNDALLQMKEAFSKEQIEIKRDSTAALTLLQETIKRDAQSLLEEQQKEINAGREYADRMLSSLLNDAKEKHSLILKFYELTAVDSVTGGHKKIADREYTSARNWRYITIGTISAAVVWVLLSIFSFPPVLEPVQLFWLSIAKSVSLTGLLLSFAVYASKQSTLHRRNEAKARSFFLKVQAFDPFVANLPSDKQSELREALSTRIFVGDEDGMDNNKGSSPDFEGMDKLVDIVGKLKSIFSK